MALIKELEHLHIPFQNIEMATKNFTTLIGKGGFGNVYKGELLLLGKLTSIVVKRLDVNISGQGFKEFLTEIHLLSRYKHPNLVSLLGFCYEGNEKILVYEHTEHGSLDKFLTMDTTVCPLTCKQKIDICIDSACGLDYLHNHAAENQRVIHMDIKSSNILLDHNWKAMLSDLGLSKLGRANENETFLITNPCGTQGYCDPMYIETGVLTKESDVYSFGVVLFEVLCGRLCFMNVNNEQRFLAPLARRYYKEGKLHEIIDPAMMEQLHLDSLNMISDIAYQCLKNDREKRPSMGLVVKRLKKAMKVQEFIKDEASELDLAKAMKRPIGEKTSTTQRAPTRNREGGGCLSVTILKGQDLEGKHHTNPSVRVCFPGEMTRTTVYFYICSQKDLRVHKNDREFCLIAIEVAIF